MYRGVDQKKALISAGHQGLVLPGFEPSARAQLLPKETHEVHGDLFIAKYLEEWDARPEHLELFQEAVAKLSARYGVKPEDMAESMLTEMRRLHPGRGAYVRGQYQQAQ